MTIEEICDKHGVQVAYFDKELWHRHGVYIDEIKIVFVNKALSSDAQKRVVLHELGHLEHNPKHYERLREKYEAQANRNMIHELLKNENLDDFNYIHFMEKYNLTTICDETFVKNEYLKLKEIEKC